MSKNAYLHLYLVMVTSYKMSWINITQFRNCQKVNLLYHFF